MRAVGLISLATGAVVDFSFCKNQGKGTGEGALLRGMLDSLNRGDVLVADRYYPTYITVAELNKRGIDMVSISHHMRKVDFTDGVVLGENDHIVEWQKPQIRPGMSAQEYEAIPETIRVREFMIGIEDRENGRVDLPTFCGRSKKSVP